MDGAITSAHMQYGSIKKEHLAFNIGDGHSLDAADGMGLIHFEIKQQAPLGSPPVVSIQLPYSYGLEPSWVVFVLTNNASDSTEGTLYLKK